MPTKHSFLDATDTKFTFATPRLRTGKWLFMTWVLLLTMVILQNAQAQSSSSGNAVANWWSRSIWDNPDRGGMWYPPARDDNQDEEAQSPTPAAPATPAQPPEVAEFKALQERLSQLRMVYLMSPTPENVKAYIELQEKVFARSALATDVWRRVLWASPELQYQGRPTNQTGLVAYDQQYGRNVRSGLSGLAQTHGLYFFFRSDCPFCHAMAPTLKAIEQSYGIKIIAISLDGKGIAEFPKAILDNGQAQALGVRSVPAYFLASPSSKTVMPLGTGVVSLGDLEDRIYTQAYTRPGDKF